jgi:hypothetical protein
MAEKDEEEQQARSFKVQDRRRFADPDAPSEDASPRDAEPARTPGPEAAPPSHAGASADVGATHGAAATDELPLQEMTFSTFVMGLTTQALMHLGEIPDPMHEQISRDLPAAKQMIDLLAILRDKTKGNLDTAEEQLLGSMLYDLRMRYVELARGR